MDRSEIRERAEQYISDETAAHFREEVSALLKRDAWEELSDRFYTDLEFGTGGLRGVIGGGTNRMNPLVVRRATEGLARYVAAHGSSPGGTLSAVIAYDSRHFSPDFAREAALIFCAHGIRTYLFSSLRPTPELSFAIRHLGAATGIVVTASHNPKQYNGYKAYWNDGSQVIPPHDQGIIDEVRRVAGTPAGMDHEAAVRDGLLVYVDREIDDAFAKAVKGASLRPALIREKGSTLKIVYTPLHGTGAQMVERVLGELGIQTVTVPEQRDPDGDFPTVEFPNPEEASALKLALELAGRSGADLVLGTDPDADRIGIAVPDGGGFRLITGNQLGVLLADYVFSSRVELGTLPKRPAFVKTIVTTELQRLVAQKYGAVTYETLTGFKWIAAKIRTFEKQPDGPVYVIGDEESYGFLIGTYVRDKDAVTAAVITAEMALFHVSRGKSVFDRLREIYRELGYFQEETISHYFPGQQGQTLMASLMDVLRKSPPATLGGIDVVEVRDYERQIRFDIVGKSESRIEDIPASNVLQFVLRGNGVVSCRPSGTEPKIKFYASIGSNPTDDLDRAVADVTQRIAGITSDIRKIIESVE